MKDFLSHLKLTYHCSYFMVHIFITILILFVFAGTTEAKEKKTKKEPIYNEQGQII